MDRQALFALAARDDVQSRLVRRQGERGWSLRHGPLARRALPALNAAHWTLLVQGVDLLHAGAHRWLQRFRFVPDARLDDVMVSYASEGGGVGPHVDAYDVFLLQVSGVRRWQLARMGGGQGGRKPPALVPGLPLKILAEFEAQETHVLQPGDMLYLPPMWAHDGVALGGDCITASVGFRSPSTAELARDVLPRMLDARLEDDALAQASARYRDPQQAATTEPARIPEALQRFAERAAVEALNDRGALARALGEALSEPKPQVWFEAGDAALFEHAGRCAVVLDARTRMLYDASHLYVNGEAYAMRGRDARLMRALADGRSLSAAQSRQLSGEAWEVLADWAQAGWLHGHLQ